MADNEYFLGLDIGSVSLNAVLMDGANSILEDHYVRLKGQPIETVLHTIEEILTRIPSNKIRGVATTGTGGGLIARLLSGNFVNEVIAQTEGTLMFHPDARTIIEIGGEDSKLILLEWDERAGQMIISDFAMNTICAAGTGSFLDQQATRLGVSIENEFGLLALKSKRPPRIAGRCSVFAKTDMIHLQQEATPDYDIIAGLCYAFARNFKSNIGKGKRFTKPIVFQGGVAANQGMIRAFKDILELEDEELIVPVHFASMGAIGAVLVSRQKGELNGGFTGTGPLKEYLRDAERPKGGLLKLKLMKSNIREGRVFFSKPNKRRIRAYLGIDVGSISTNVVALDEQKNLLAKRYLMTAGRPIEAVRQGIEEIGQEIGEGIEVVGVGTTGSGRYLIGDFVGADVVKNEITAQARASAEIDPQVDTIFEIGGQDSKYISLDGGTIVDFEMNKVCAAGTGSFLEEQAERLNIDIKGEFESLALSSSSPVSLGERCTVFMETDLNHHQQMGSERGDLVAGLSYSIVHNYLNRVVGDKRIGENIFFQGGVAANRGVIAAFENVLGKPITVPPHHEVTGAIGAAILAMEEHPGNGTRFRGFDLSKRRYGIESFECGGCPNTCEVKKVSIEGERPLFYGSRCEKYDIRGQKEKAEIPDLFSEREALLLSYVDSNNKGLGAKRIGIPRILFFYDLLPLFATFFQELGFQVILSDKTNKKTIHDGLEQIVAETCFPIKVAHGHVLNLLEKDLDFVFLPSLINLMQDNPKIEGSYACPYVQAFPYTIKAAIDFESSDVEVLQPILHLRRGIGGFLDEMSGLSCKLERDKATIKQAARKAWRAQLDFLEKIEQRGQEILKDLKRWEFAIVIVSRPYNGCDSGINLDLPRKLLKLGAIAIPMDFLPLKTIDLSHDWPNMYWRYGQRILAAADLINRNPRLNAIYITNFGCGPDSFILKFFKERMSGRPYLQIEIDEHSADVGAITRCEAFLDSLRHAKRKEVIKTRRKRHAKLSLLNRTIYIPYMGDQSYGLRAAFLACGIQAEVIPESDQKTLELGRRYTTGKECYPCIITTGDMVKMVQDPDFDRDRSAFFMPTGRGPCRFGQYHKLHEMVLDEIGYQDVPIIAPNQGESLYRDLGEVGKGFLRLAWLGILGIDLLDKKLRETRPYEVKPGTTDRVYKECLDEFCQAIIERRDIAERLKRCRERLDEVETHIMDKPVIGIVGEIFVRSNHFSNSYIIRMIEDLGGEVWLPPITEWILYTNYTRKLLLKEKKKYLSLVGLLLKDFFQRRTEDRIAEIFRGSIKNLEEPGIEDTLEYSRRFLDPSFEGEAVLSIGKSIDFISKGASGLVNVMPFTCMPGTIVTSILKLVREQNENIPCLYMAFDGLEQTNTKTRLEAFMHQATQFHKRRLETSIYP